MVWEVVSQGKASPLIRIGRACCFRVVLGGGDSCSSFLGYVRRETTKRISWLSLAWYRCSSQSSCKRKNHSLLVIYFHMREFFFLICRSAPPFFLKVKFLACLVKLYWVYEVKARRKPLYLVYPLKFFNSKEVISMFQILGWEVRRKPNYSKHEAFLLICGEKFVGGFTSKWGNVNLHKQKKHALLFLNWTGSNSRL